MFSKRLFSVQSLKICVGASPSLYNLSLNLGLKGFRNVSTFIHEVTKDQSKIFFSDEAQALMKQMTGLDLDKVFRRKAIAGSTAPPTYKFMTNEQLREAQSNAVRKAYSKLQMPPIIPAVKEKLEVLQDIPQMIGFTKSKYVFTDITFNVKDRDRWIVVREPDGVLRKAYPSERHRMNELYFPRPGRSYTIPRMFQEEYLIKLLKKKQYEFILDRACSQFEPDDIDFHRVVFMTFEQINENKEFECLRSTRHFGPFSFYLCVTKTLTGLLEEMLQTERLPDAVSLVQLYSLIHPDCKFNSLNADTSHETDYLKEFLKAEYPENEKLLHIVETYWQAQQTSIDSNN